MCRVGRYTLLYLYLHSLLSGPFTYVRSSHLPCLEVCRLQRMTDKAELDMDWIHPRIGLDWVGLDWVILCNIFCGLDWIGSDGEK